MALAILSAALAACGGGKATRSDAAAALCAIRQVSLLGDLDGQTIDATVDMDGYNFQQATPPYTLDVMYTGGTLNMQFTDLISSAMSSTATGTIVMPAVTPHAGETICAAAGTIAIEQFVGDGQALADYIFTLTDLSLGPTCPGTSVAGSMLGCLNSAF